jgi:hypothetical protein
MTGGGIGSNMGGRWVEEGTVPARNVGRLGVDSVRTMQERGNTAGPGN